MDGQPVDDGLQDLGPYGLKGRGIVRPVAPNPYDVPDAPTAGGVPAAQGLQLPSMAEYIAKQATADKKDLGALTPDEIKEYGKRYAAYDKDNLTDLSKNGPLVHALGGNYKGTRENFELHHAYHARQALDELDQRMPDMQAYLKSLVPAGATASGEATAGPADSLGNELTRSLHTGLGMAATAMAGVPTALANVQKMVNPLAPANADIEESDAAQKWQNYFFGLADKASAAADKIPQPGKDIPSRVMGVVGSLPGGIVSLGMDKPIQEARNEIAKGTDLDEVKKNLAIDAAKSLILSKVPGGNLLARGAKGAALNPILDNASALLKGQQTPDAVDNLLSAIFGAGFASVLGRRPGEVAKPGAGTPEVKPGAAPVVPGAGDADALAASVAGNKGAIDTSKIVDPKTGLPPVPPTGATAPLHSDHLSALEEEALGGDALLGVKTPEQAQQYIDTFAKDYNVPPEQMGALTDAVNSHLRDAHGDNAPQAQPMQAQAPTEPSAVPENQAPAATPIPETSTAVAPTPVEPAKPTFTLPPSISRAKPKYGLDRVGFDSDVDKALYIVGGPNKSRAHNDYVDWLKNEVGLNGKQITDMSARVKTAVKEASRNNRNAPGEETHFDLPALDHPELAPKPVEAPKAAAVEPVAPVTAAPESPSTPVVGAVVPPVIASKPRVRANPLTGRIEPVVKTKAKYNPLTGKLEPKFQMTELPPRGGKASPKR